MRSTFQASVGRGVLPPLTAVGCYQHPINTLFASLLGSVFEAIVATLLEIRTKILTKIIEQTLAKVEYINSWRR